MKKMSRKERERRIRLGVIYRSGIKKRKRPINRNLEQDNDDSWRVLNGWIDRKIKSSELKVEVGKKREITIFLPEKMNFSDCYEQTAVLVTAIRQLCTSNKGVRLKSGAYKLKSVCFDKLKEISTSAALVLTAELSKWDDSLRVNLLPRTENWDPYILRQFAEIGFFELFNRKPPVSQYAQEETHPLNLVKYIKGRCNDSEKAKELKLKISDIVGEQIIKWTFLHAGLTEAITNVSHHAYPDNRGFSILEKNWYLTGSFNKQKNQLKIVFYDQGIGIPKTLPSSHVWEHVLEKFADILTIGEGTRDSTMLKAAVEYSRTRTGENDRGKGLSDLLTFIRQRGQGYLSILSLKGLYKFTVNGQGEKIKTESFVNPINGTLIIWCVTL